MKRFLGVMCSLALSAVAVTPMLAQDNAKMTERLNHAADVLQEVMQTPDKGIPQQILSGAKCVVVIPELMKGAFIVGGQHGEGVATCRTANGWSAPVFVRLNGASFGAQIGAQTTDLVLVAMNHKGLQDLLEDKFKFGGGASVSAGPVGRTAQAATDARLSSEFLAYSRSKGLFAGIDLNGDSVSKNGDDTRAEYGADIPFQTILSGHTPTPPNARNFVHTVAKYFVVSRANS